MASVRRAGDRCGGPPEGYLRKPRLRVWRDRGRFQAIDLWFRTPGSKASYGVTPDPRLMVTFDVDRAGDPCGYGMDYPVDAAEFLRALRLFLAGYSWSRPTHPPRRLESGVLDLLLRGYEMAAPALEEWRASLRRRRPRKVPA